MRLHTTTLDFARWSILQAGHGRLYAQDQGRTDCIYVMRSGEGAHANRKCGRCNIPRNTDAILQIELPGCVRAIMYKALLQMDISGKRESLERVVYIVYLLSIGRKRV